MHYYRAYCLRVDGRIFWGHDVQATDTNGAIAAAQEMCRGLDDWAEDQVEVWSGPNLLFSSSRSRLRPPHARPPVNSASLDFPTIQPIV